MGQRGSDCWKEIWDIILPMLDSVYHGESTAVEDGLLVIDRSGYLEEGYYTYTYSPIVDESGNVGGAFCIVYDTTERVIGERRLRTLRDLASRSSTAKTAEEACRAAAETLAANPQDIPFAAIYLYDAEGEQANLVATAGIEPGAPASPVTIGRNTESPIAAAALSGRIEVIENLAEILGPLPGGSWPVGAESGIVIPMTPPGHAQPAGFLVSGVSPRKRLDASYRTFLELVNGQIATAVAEARAYEEERKRAEALAELDRAKTVFFSNISHEFRTPLTLMLGPVEDLLVRAGQIPPAARQELELIHRNGLRLLKLVNTLLEFARIEAGRVQAVYEPTDLSAFTCDLASVFRSAIEKAGLRLVIDCPPLPEPVYVDRDMWEKIVLNLLSNALKFTFEGEIAISIRAVDGSAEVAIRDTGIGIPAADAPHIFERFHRVEGARGRTMEGSGIGLALVQELVKLHGGSIRVESETGRGTTFTVSLPMGREHLSAGRVADAPRSLSTLGARPYLEEALRWLPDSPHVAADILELPSMRDAEAAVPEDAEPDAGAHRPRILVADDNADMREYIRRLLAGGYDVETVSNGLAAMVALRSRPFDMVLADLMMPHLDGFGLLREIRQQERTRLMPVVLLSALGRRGGAGRRPERRSGRLPGEAFRRPRVDGACIVAH
jgi:signal transduction histidine kinase